jgi:uncharacterized membrane protein SpoIIM required for sporulation
MVLEDIVTASSAEQKPLNLLPITFLYATLSIFLALWIFPSHAAIVSVFLITLACAPLMLNIFLFEKQKEEASPNYLKDLLSSLFPQVKGQKTQDKLISLFVYVFLGLSLAITFWFVVLPQNMLHDLFYLQLNTIREINLSLSGGAVFTSFYSAILANNLKVLAFSVLFSFVYGAGAIFIIAWNASVIGVAMGDTIKRGLVSVGSAVGFDSVAGYSSAISAGLLRYLMHGIPEILAYFVGALAGAMLSIAVLHHEYDSPQFQKTIQATMSLIGFAVVLLIFAGLIEVGVSPLIR